jgi:hypothetical protein
MTIGLELEAQILRYYHVEKWRCGTIARQLHVHRGTVQRVLAQAGLPRIGAVLRPAQIDAYLPFIHETLKKFPSLTASRLYAMVSERCTAHGLLPRLTCACARCLGKSASATGRISIACRSGVRAGP